MSVKPGQAKRLCAQERAQIAAVLSELPTSWRNVRAINELQRVVGS
jgi:hypothetical protein